MLPHSKPRFRARQVTHILRVTAIAWGLVLRNASLLDWCVPTLGCSSLESSYFEAFLHARCFTFFQCGTRGHHVLLLSNSFAYQCTDMSPLISNCSARSHCLWAALSSNPLASRSVKSVTKTWRGSCVNEKEPNSSMSPLQVLLAVWGWCYVLIFVGYLARRSQEAVGCEMLRGLICSGVNRHGTCRTCPPFQESDLRFLIDDLHNFRILAGLLEPCFK